MIQTVLGVFLILLHIVCCVLVWLGIKTHLLKVKKYLMALVIFVPFWGTVCVLLLHLQMMTRRDNRIEMKRFIKIFFRQFRIQTKRSFR